MLVDDDSALPAQRSVTLLNERSNAEIYAAILTQGPLSRTEVSRLTGFSQSTITKAVQPMLGDGYLVEGAEQQAGVGRPQVPLRVNNARHTVVGFKLARDEVIGVVIDLGAEVLAAQHRKLADRSVETAVEAISSLTTSLFAADPAYAERAVGIGIGVGGHVDGRTGVVRESPILGWHDVPLGELVEAAVGLPTVVENDVNALAVAEQWFGAGRDVDWFAVVTVGAGVGCGLVLDGTLAHGATGAAGELGHVTIDPDGAPLQLRQARLRRDDRDRWRHPRGDPRRGRPVRRQHDRRRHARPRGRRALPRGLRPCRRRARPGGRDGRQPCQPRARRPLR